MDELTQRYRKALSGTDGSARMAVIIDGSPLMQLHEHAVAPIRRAAREVGAPVSALGGASSLLAADHRSLLSGGIGVIGVVTDTQDRKWRGPSLLPWLAELAANVPVVLLHLLDRSAWSRGPVTLKPLWMREMPPTASSSWSFASSVADTEPHGPPPDTVVVPLLECAPESVAAAVSALTASRPDWKVDAWVLTGGGRSGSAPREVPEPVAHFLANASSGARELAVRLAQTPVNLPAAEVIQRGIPRAPVSGLTARTEIAEVFGSELMDPAFHGGRLDDPSRGALEFRAEVRRELLGRFGQISTMRSVFYAIGIEFKDEARIFQYLSRIDSGAPVAVSVEGEESLARAVLPALSEMPGEYRRLADRIREALGEAPVRDPSAPREEESRSVTTSQIPVPDPAGSVADSTDRSSASPRRRMARFGGVPPHNRNFTGREDVLARIHASLSDPGGDSFLLAGGGGIGKTQIAIAYAHTYRGSYDLVWWFPAENQTDIQQSYLRLARHLGVRDDLGAEETVVQVRERLEGDPGVGTWLLIFDDVSNLDDLPLDNLPHSVDGRVLVTSRDKNWITNGLSDGCSVPTMSPDESVALLRKVCPAGLEGGSAAAQIAARLEHFPLALAQMGAYLRDSLLSTDEFLELLDTKFDDLVSQVESDGLYPRSLAAAWKLQLDDLRRGTGRDRELKHMVREFIQLCAFFAPKPLSRTLFHRAAGLSTSSHLSRVLGNDMVLSKVLTYVGRHSLAERDLAHNTFQLHVTFRSVVQQSLDDEDRLGYRLLAHRLLAQSDPLGPGRPENWDTYQLLFAHTHASEAWRNSDPQVRNLMYNTISYLVETGNYTPALQLTDRCAASWYDDVSQRFQVQLLRNRILRSQGHNRTALAEAEHMHAEQSELEGAESEEALAALRARAIALANLGHFTEAEELFRGIYELRLERYSEEEETLVAAHDYATILQNLSRYEEALRIDRRNAEQRARLLGENAISTLRSRLSVGVSLIAVGRLEEAEEVLEDCQQRFEVTGAATSVHSVDIPLFLSVIRRRLGDHERALELSLRVETGHHKKRVQQGVTALYFWAVHTVNLAFGGRVEEACRRAEYLLGNVAEHYPDHHPFPWVARVNAAIAFRTSGDLKRAFELDSAALEGLVRIYGESEATTIPARINLANDFFALGRIQEARTRDADGVEQCRASLDENHVSLLIARRNHLISRRALGEDVEEEWEGLRQECIARFGAEHRFTTTMSRFIRLDCDMIPVAR
ncbi:FxSxx-COOH system tetratricopeptide repeat protein [Nocardiopsis sp. HUAS JQ3]|uniref:FxSxx-COOH system tetratricopeptide repeat protein n=1 Tax=Nocardiopsis sp. HUAS JQ3 TaxID=3061629 RepID=UPI0023A92AE4|nr:FxSxx-COOH system tetratricopeptide repeat protein [Nocardiopsis sp. HUAS JQ3]WDZ90738.1 FxSxx-COOH system tetratricopeptide repeat protein [Nocardiopsis sp. HUAS JQ3]